MMKRCLLILLVSVAVLGVEVPAATRTAANCSFAAVSAAMASAAEGDTVVIPAGSCTWTSTLTVSKGITIAGAGSPPAVGSAGQTTLVDAVDGALFYFAVDQPQAWRLTNVSIRSTVADSNASSGTIHVGGSTRAFRVDHNTLTNQNNLIQIFLMGSAIGVIDHNTLRGSYTSALFMHHTRWGGSNWGDASWAAPTALGTDQFVFYEDNDYTDETSGLGGAITDCNTGSRLVVRHNTFRNAGLSSHGTEDRRRGCRAFELYNNTFTVSGGTSRGLDWVLCQRRDRRDLQQCLHGLRFGGRLL